MRSRNPGPNDSRRPRVLGADGRIDLSGGHHELGDSERPTTRPSGDGWLLERERRSLAPPPTAGVSEGIEDEADELPDDIHREIADLFALGDFAAALSAAELQLGVDPGDESARQYAETSRLRLEARYTTRIGSLDYIFNLGVPAAKVKWLGLDPQAAFLLSLIDGQTSVADVLELTQLGRLEALRVFTELLEAKAIVRVA